MVAKTYIWPETESSTIKVMVSVPVGRTKRFILAMMEISNGEHTDILHVLHHTDRDLGHGSCKDNGIQSLRYCSVFRNMIKLNSLYSSSPFTNPKTDDCIDAQIGTYNRLTEIFLSICRHKEFKTIQSAFVTKHFSAMEKRKFLNTLDSSDLTEYMKMIRSKLIISTTLDK